MNKKVIVVSTYYLSPCPSKNEKILFNKESVTQVHFSDKRICDFFWDNIKNRDKLIDKIRKEYISEDGKRELSSKGADIISGRKANLDSFLESNKEWIKALIEDAGLEIEFDTENTDWIFELSLEGDKIIEKDKELFNELLSKEACLETDVVLELLKDNNHDGIWITEHLNRVGKQDGFEIYLPNGVSTSTDGYQSEPWIYNRLSYYQLKPSKDDSDVDVFAVWPIKTLSPMAPEDNTKNEWIDALSDQFLSLERELGNEVDCLYLVLHAKDVMSRKGQEDVLFEDTYNGKDRVVIVFEHTEDIGEVLLCDEKKKDVDILEFVETKYKKVNNSYTEIERIIHNKDFKVEQDEETMAKIRKLNNEIKGLLRE